MNKQLFSLVLSVGLCANLLQGQATLTFPVNTWQAIQDGQATVAHTQLDIGTTANMFDGDFNTVARTANINPLVVTLAFDYTINVTAMSTRQTEGSGWWTVEAANSVADLDSHSGSYQLLFSQSPLAQGVTVNVPVSVSKKAFRLIMRRTTGDNYVHIMDWGITATASVQVAGLCFRPNQVRMIKNSTYDMKVMGVDAAGNQYPLPSGLTWASSNTAVAAVTNSGTLTSFGSTGTTNLTASWNGLSKTIPMKVVEDFTTPLAPQRVVKVALVIIDPPIPAAGGKRFSQVPWTEHYGAPLSWEQLSAGSPMQLAQKVRDSLTAVSGGVAKYEFVETHDDNELHNTFGQVNLSVDSAYHLFKEPGWDTWHLVAEQQGQSVFRYNELLDKYDFCEKSNNHQIDEVWVYAMPFIGMWETNMTGTDAFWINGPVITGNSCTDLLNIMGLNYERSYDLALHNFGHRTETTLYHLFNQTVRYTPADPPYPPGTGESALRLFFNYDAIAPGHAHVGNVHFPPNADQNYGYYSTNTVTTYDQNWKRYPFLFQQTRQINCSDWNCEHDGFMRWWLSRLPKYKCLDKDGYLNNWWLYVIDYNEGKAMEAQLAGCDCQMFDDAVTTDYCASTSNFPWEDWIAKVKVGTIDNASGKSPYSNFTNLSTNLNTGTTPFQLTTGFSYFTWDEYWRVWIDLNHDGDFEDAGEKVFEGIKTKPANGTPTATLSGNLTIPTSAMTGPTRMRVTMKRGAYATPCETIAFGEIEDYTVNIQASPAQLPNLLIPSYEVIPANVNCFASPGGNFGYFSGLVLNNSSTNAGPFTLKSSFSKDNQSSADDVPWQVFQYTGLTPNNVVSFSMTNPVPASLAPGRYYILVRADADNQVNESNETDNIVFVQVNVGAPDFALTAVNGVPASTAAGSTLNLATEVTNLLPFPLLELQGNLLVKTYLSADNQFSTTNDVEIGSASLAFSQFSNGPLYNGGKAAVNVAALVPGTTPQGNYFLFVTVGDACETSILNNRSNALPIQITTGGTPGTYCASSSNFPWEDWIAKVELADLSNPSGKSPYSNFTNLTAHVNTGQSYTVKLTTGYSYFTWDEYWTVWIDFNHDGVFSSPNEVVQMQKLTAPAAGTPTATITGSVNIPASALSGPTRMRVSMKRGAYATACETLPFGEVEDYTVNISTGPAQLPNLSINSVEVVPGGGGTCFTNPGQTFLVFSGLSLNSGLAPAGPFTINGWWSKDQQLSANDLLWQTFQFSGVAANDVVYWNFSNSVPTSLAPGIHYVIIRIDSENTVTESNESDNERVIGVFIGAPDFTVSNVAGVPASTAAGSNLNLSVETTNLVSFPLAEIAALQGYSGLSATIYLSADNQFSTINDVQLGMAPIAYNQFSNPPLYLNGKATVNIPVAIPGNTVAGNYFIFVELSGSCDKVAANNLSNPIPLQITTGTPGTYCTSTSNFPWEDWIARVQLNTLDNSSGKSPYSNFTALSTTLQKDHDYTITLTTGFSYFTWPEYWNVWIDYNHDGVFSEPDELAFSKILSPPAAGTPQASVSGTFKLPPSALTGPTRMRITMKRNGNASPCETIAFGEIEDYTVNIVNNFGGGGTDDRATSLSFEAVRERTWVKLDGVFHSREAVAGIFIEKSLDGHVYETLESAPGSQRPDAIETMRTVDKSPVDGFNFYRMKMVLENGTALYSPVRIVSFDVPLDFTIFPNPASTEIFIQLSEPPSEEMTWTVYDALGRPIWSQDILQDAAFPYRIDAQFFEAGIYYLYAQRAGMRAVGKRFVITR
ncbi:MAG: hypothetical protein KDD27_19445 [Saprospiraceae bacterium]|nr:hypothetical protein [Saprospiraceae bacterium]